MSVQLQNAICELQYGVLKIFQDKLICMMERTAKCNRNILSQMSSLRKIVHGREDRRI